MVNISGCGGPTQGAAIPAGVNAETETVISGVVVAGADPVPGAYVRLLDAQGDFTAEVVSSPGGQFRFFAAPGTWQLRALSRAGNGGVTVSVDRGVNEVTVPVGG